MSVIRGGSVIESVRAAGIALAPEAKVFVVDPDDASFTLQDAIDAAVAGQGDVILRLPGTETVTQTVNFNKAGITVMAVGPTLNPLSQGEFHALLADAAFTDGPVAQITERCVIDGLGFVSRDAGATFFAGAALLVGGNADANPFGVVLRRCRFPKWAVANRIGVAFEGSTDCLVDECVFEGVGADFNAGVYVQGATQNLVVRRSLFRSCTYAIEHGAFAGGGPHCFYHENLCEDAKLLKAGGNAATGLVAGNWLETATDAGSYDDTVVALKALGLNFAGNRYSEQRGTMRALLLRALRNDGLVGFAALVAAIAAAAACGAAATAVLPAAWWAGAAAGAAGAVVSVPILAAVLWAADAAWWRLNEG